MKMPELLGTLLSDPHVLASGLGITLVCSLWMGLVLAVRRPVTRRLGARFAYALWLTPLVALVFAVIQKLLPESLPGAGLALLELPSLDLLIKGTANAVGALEASASANATPNLPGITAVLSLIWLLGTVTAWTLLVVHSSRFSSAIERDSRPLDPGHSRLMHTIGNVSATKPRQEPRAPSFPIASLPAKLDVRLSRHGPAVARLWHPVLLLPEDFFERYSPAQRALILQHELHHLRRHDLAWLMLARLYRGLFWFNPLAWLAERTVQLDQELSCDEYVLSRRDSATRRLYGETLLDTVGALRPLPQAPYRPTFRQLKERTQMLKHHCRGAGRRLLGTLLVSITVLISAAYAGVQPETTAPVVELRAEVFAVLKDIQTRISEQIETDETDRAAFAELLTELEAQTSTFDPNSVSDYELAQITNLSGYLAYLMQDYRLAIDSYRPILDLVPEIVGLQSATLKTIAQLHFTLDEYEEAIVYLDRLEALSDGRADVLMLQGQARYQLNAYAAAADYVDRAIARVETDGEVPREQWLQLQVATHDEIGDAEGARQALIKLNRLYPKPDYGQRLEAP
ncbi:M56 family metallopeptidase [Elongatibacter sediminis]|uniref:M56 family metallopeptidase n=1 Tax=Elongatibacter sediminis TaxID=3119006 RepID=A0AAW9R639_9GAMM